LGGVADVAALVRLAVMVVAVLVARILKASVTLISTFVETNVTGNH